MHYVGNIIFKEWESYPWKNELSCRSEQVVIHFNEVFSEDFEGEHEPLDMLDRAIVLAGFSVRRLIERKLVTDRLAKTKISVRSFVTKPDVEFRIPFHSLMGGDYLIHNVDCEKQEPISLSYNDLANQIIHSSPIMVCAKNQKMDLLIASDWNVKTRLLHLTIDEVTSFVRAVLDDRVTSMTDFRGEAGNAHSKRDG
jgi:hypothetical protein